MDDPIHFFEPAAGHGLPHDPLKAIVGPRPIGWVATVDAAGRVNLAPYSFFAMVGDAPPMLMFSSSGWKDSVANAETTRMFTWSLATRPLADRMNETSRPVAHGVDEFTLAGLTPRPGRLVATPGVAGSPASIECRVVDVIRLNDIDGRATDQWMVVGQAVGVHIDRRFLVDGLFDTGGAHPILRAGYRADYVEVRPDTMFSMVRPTTA